MTLIWLLTYFGVFSQNINLQNISYAENIDYCTNIIHNPYMQDEFNKNCNLDLTNKYIMFVKNHES